MVGSRVPARLVPRPGFLAIAVVSLGFAIALNT